MQVVSSFVERIVSQAELRVENLCIRIAHRCAHPSHSGVPDDNRDLGEAPSETIELAIHIPSLVYTADAESEPLAGIYVRIIGRRHFRLNLSRSMRTDTMVLTFFFRR
jgi:hypothetical protein